MIDNLGIALTDNDVVKALEHCLFKDHRQSKCTECEYTTGCKSWLMREALDLIKRQQAEIERLEKNLDEKNEEIDKVYDELADSVEITAVIKSEAIKEFAESLKDRVDDPKRIKGAVIE